MKNLFLVLSVVISIVLVAFAISSINDKGDDEVKSETSTAVSREGDIQIISVTATNGGYYPKKIDAEANIPTLLRVDSKNSYGCERSFRIPKLNITEILPQQGTTEIDLGTPKEGESILGSCSMGMYTFTIKFN